MTDRELADTIGLFERNGASPCITDLIHSGVLYEFDDVVCPTTKAVVRRVWLRPQPWIARKVVTVTIKLVGGTLDLSKIHDSAVEFSRAIHTDASDTDLTTSIRYQDGKESTREEVLRLRPTR